MKSCPECLSEIPDGAVCCAHCGERVLGKRCPECCTVIANESRKCRYCGFEFQPAAPRVELEPFSVNASLIPTMLLKGRFLTQSIQLTQEKIVISTPGFAGLSKREEEIPWKKVAGFDYRSGIIWDVVRIETRGQSSSVVSCLPKATGQKIRSILQQLED